MTAESGPRFASVLCPIDFSEPSTRALQYAIALAGCERGRVTLIDVAHPLLVEAASAAYDATFVEDADRELRSVASAYRVLCLATAPVLALPSWTDAPI